MAIEGWINVLGVLVAALTVGVLVAGVVFLRAMASVRVWDAYLGAVVITLLVMTWAGLKMNRLWEAAGNRWDKDVALNDADELPIVLWLNAPFAAIMAIFTSGVVLWLVGRTAAKDRAAHDQSPLPAGQRYPRPGAADC